MRERSAATLQVQVLLLIAAIDAAAGGANINTAAITRPKAADWPSYGRDYREQRFGEVDQINADTVARLGLAWSFDTDYLGGMEATPLVVDGVMYVTGTWSVVYALDAATGALLWKFDPQVPKAWGKMACCDVVNRGVALYQGKVFVGSLDARLIALDAATGSKLWEVQTADTAKFPYTITGAPRAAKGKVFIGNGGAEFGVRGFVSAYDVDTGALMWRFYTVPGNPADGFENDAMAMAAETWTGEWWKYGGGGTVWDTIVYDPELDQLYLGVGNGSPWNRKVRSPQGGDNLFLSSIVALNPDTGKYLWHYQETPAETWDYTATQQIMLAEMEIGGRLQKVIWQAPKNGHFFIIDRTSGKLLSAQPYTKVTWTTGYDLTTGRPKQTPEAQWVDRDDAITVYPSGGGGHNWQPMSFNPNTGLVYFTSYGFPSQFRERPYEHQWGEFNLGTELMAGNPVDGQLMQTLTKRTLRVELIAWNPQQQQSVWRMDMAGVVNGGTLTTTGNLVFVGDHNRDFLALRADTGEVVWRFATQDVPLSGPSTYVIDDQQYVAVSVGSGGAMGLGMSVLDPRPFPARSRILAFKLNGRARLPALPEASDFGDAPAPTAHDRTMADRGEELYGTYCFRCHSFGGASNGRVPDLRRLPRAFYDNFSSVVIDGTMAPLGMPSFKAVLTANDAEALKAYLLIEAEKDKALRAQPVWWVELKQSVYDMIARIAAQLM
jgi:quinohemoprotein ethanol dehydrogenase